jgi:hypothetical protein
VSLPRAPFAGDRDRAADGEYQKQDCKQYDAAVSPPLTVGRKPVYLNPEVGDCHPAVRPVTSVMFDGFARRTWSASIGTSSSRVFTHVTVPMDRPRDCATASLRDRQVWF